jgi:hypothetical protein
MNDRWDAAEREEFFRRLKRRKSHYHRVQDIDAKARQLERSNDPTQLAGAYELHQLICQIADSEPTGETDHEFFRQQAENAEADMARIRWRQRRHAEALQHFRKALSRTGDGIPSFWILDMSRVILETQQRHEYPTMLDLLNKFCERNASTFEMIRQPLFEAGFLQAVLSAELGLADAAKSYARGAQAVLTGPDHGIRPDMGVGKVSAKPDEIERLAAILGS